MRLIGGAAPHPVKATQDAMGILGLAEKLGPAPVLLQFQALFRARGEFVPSQPELSTNCDVAGCGLPEYESRCEWYPDPPGLR